MKILVFSDSHASRSFMRLCMERIKPDAFIHLGDYYEDGEAIAEEFPGVPNYRVPGNCDYYRMAESVPGILSCKIAGVQIYMTHGHLHGVKSATDRLLKEARKEKAQAVLYGHTHQAECYQEKDGMWVLNPGSCGSYGGSAGMLLIEENKIQGCWLLHPEDLLQK